MIHFQDILNKWCNKTTNYWNLCPNERKKGRVDWSMNPIHHPPWNGSQYEMNEYITITIINSFTWLLSVSIYSFILSIIHVLYINCSSWLIMMNMTRSWRFSHHLNVMKKELWGERISGNKSSYLWHDYLFPSCWYSFVILIEWNGYDCE